MTSAVYWLPLPLMTLAVVAMLVGAFTRRSKVTHAGMLAAALTMVIDAAYFLHKGNYGWAATTAALAAVNLGNYFRNRSIQRRRAARA